MIVFEQADGFKINIPETWKDLDTEQFFAMVNTLETNKDNTEMIVGVLLKYPYPKEILSIPHSKAPVFTELLSRSIEYFRNTPPDFSNISGD